MIAAPLLALLVVLVWLKPQEWFEPLAGLPTLEVASLGIAGAIALERRFAGGRVVVPRGAVLACAFAAIAVVSRLASSGTFELARALKPLAVLVAVALAIALGAPSLRALGWIAGGILVSSAFVATVALEQGLAPLGCAIQEGDALDALRPDGRACSIPRDCEEGGEPGARYQCERVGWLGTLSVGGGRVRYRGVLKDPNELALAVAASAPFAIEAARRRARVGGWGLALAFLGLATTVVLWTRSRGGLLVLAAAVGTLGVVRWGRKAAALAAVAGLGALSVAGRAGEEADASSTERSELLGAALRMFGDHPILGVGFDRFKDHAPLTAHNAYALALAEVGIAGFCSFLLWIAWSIVVPLRVLERHGAQPEAAEAVSLARSILASLVAVLVGGIFLSVTYHQLVWIALALAAALDGAVRRHDPAFRVELSRRELAWVAGAAAGFPLALFAFVRARGV